MTSQLYRITIQKIMELANFINLNPAYQRDYVAETKRDWQRKLITSIFIGDLVIPNLYARTSSLNLARGMYDNLVEFGQLTKDHLSLLTEMIDGQQRFRTIIDFLNDKFPLESCVVIDHENRTHSDISKMCWSDVEVNYPKIATKFLETELRIVAAHSEVESEIMDMFTKLNDLNKMTDAEKRNALDTAIAAYVRGTSRIGRLGKHYLETEYFWPLGTSNEVKRHPLFSRNLQTLTSEYFSFKFRRMAQDEMLAKIIAIVTGIGLEEGVGNPTLLKMYMKKATLTTFNSKKVDKVLDKLYIMVEDKQYKKNINLGTALNLTMIVNYLLDTKSIRVKNWHQVMDWFMNTHNKLSTPTKKQLKEGIDETKYHLMTRLNSDGFGLSTRLQYLLNELDSCVGIVGVDPKRVISDKELFNIWIAQLNDGGKQICKDCTKPIRFDEAIKGHIVAHSEGGETTVENTKVICSECNKPRD